MLKGVRNALALRWGAYMTYSRRGSGFKGYIVRVLVATSPFWCLVVVGFAVDINSVMEEHAIGVFEAVALGVGVGGLCFVFSGPAVAYMLSDTMLMRMLAIYDNPNDHYYDRLLTELSWSGRYPVEQVEEFFLYRHNNKLSFREVPYGDWREGRLYQVIRKRIERLGK